MSIVNRFFDHIGRVLRGLQNNRWTEKTLPEISGISESVEVKCSPFPVGENSCGDIRFPYPDFGSEFRHELMDVVLMDWRETEAAIKAKGGIRVTVSTNNMGPINVDIDCKKVSGKMQFYCDLADALIDSFERARIAPK